jgi:Na+-translocating ferredoxin:NAD+ oxidoreductase RnfG subunit
VTVAFNADGTIASIRVGEDRFAETPGYGALAQQDGFLSQFIGKLPPLTMANPGAPQTESTITKIFGVDTWTSATITTQTILDAVNQAFGARP